MSFEYSPGNKKTGEQVLPGFFVPNPSPLFLKIDSFNLATFLIQHADQDTFRNFPGLLVHVVDADALPSETADMQI